MLHAYDFVFSAAYHQTENRRRGCRLITWYEDFHQQQQTKCQMYG